MPRITPKIPQGLEELMLNLAKSVIKENPQNLYEFAADYFEKLLKERDGKVDDSYKKLPAYKAYKRAKLEKNRLEVEGIKVELEARRRTGSAQTSKSFSRSSSATKNVEKLPKIASSSAVAESVPGEAESSRKSAKKLPNISGTAGKVAIGAVAVGVAAGAVKPALMAVKPQRKSEEVVDYNDNVEGSQGEDGNLESVTQNAAEDGVDLVGTEVLLAESEGSLGASGDAQKEDENPAQNLENSELISADLETNPAEITGNIEPELNPETSELSALKLELMPKNAQDLHAILEIEPQSSPKAAINSENQASAVQKTPKKSQNPTPEPQIFSEPTNSPVPTQPDSSNLLDDFIECSTVDINFLNRESSPNDDIIAENSNEIMENSIDSNERKVDGNVCDKMNEISEIAGNENNYDENIGVTDKSGGNEVDLGGKTGGNVDENVGNSGGFEAGQKVEGKFENVESFENIEVTKLAKVQSINSASSGENDYHSSNPSIKSSEFSNLSRESVKYQVLNVSSDTQESQSFDDNFVGNIEAETENLLESSSDSKLVDLSNENLIKPDPKVEEPSEFGSELINKIRYFEENNEILEDSEKAVEDMETKFEKFGEIMRKIEESDERSEEDFVRLSGEVENESGNLTEVVDKLGDELGEIEGELDSEVRADVKEQDLGPELANQDIIENDVAPKFVDMEDMALNLMESKENLGEIEEKFIQNSQNAVKNAEKSAQSSVNLPENAENLTENAEKLVEIERKLENLEAIAESSGKIDENAKMPDNENQNDSKLNPEDESDQIAKISEVEATKLQKIDENDDKNEFKAVNTNTTHDTDGHETKDAEKVVEIPEESLETSEYDLDDFIPEDPNETSESPIKKSLEVQQSIDESSKIFEQEVINIENILDTFEKLSPEVADYKVLFEDDSDGKGPKLPSSNDLADSEDTNTNNLDDGVEIREDKATLNKETEPTVDSQVISIQNNLKSPKMSSESTKIQNDQKSHEKLPETPQNPLPTTPSAHQEPKLPTSPDYYHEIDSKATTAEMKDDDFIFKSPGSTDISKIIEQKFTVDNKSTKKSAQGKESETSGQNDIELSQENANEAATGSDNCEKEIKGANEKEIGEENGNFNSVDDLMAEEEGIDKDKAAVKIQSLFRGYQVRKSGKIEKFEEKLDEIVNNKFVPKVQEPSEFGAELVSKIQEFEENVEDLEGAEEVVEDMEVKFEKFGEIMRKIEESGENVGQNEAELDVKVESADNFEKIVEISDENGNNLDAVEESDPKSSRNYLHVKHGPVKSASYKEIVQAINVDTVDVVPKESLAKDSYAQNYEDITSTVDGNITETSKDEDFIDILLDEPTENESEQHNVQEFETKSTRTKRSISPETGEVLTEVTLRIDPDDSWTEDFDALKVTKTHQIRPKSALRPLQHEIQSRNSKEIQERPNLLSIDHQTPQNCDQTSQNPQNVPEGVDEVDSRFDGQDNQAHDSPADNPHPLYPVDIKVTNKDINKTILDNSEQIKQRIDGTNDKLIEAKTKAEKKSELEENEEAEINEIFSKSERPIENADNVVGFSLNGLQSGGKIDTSLIKGKEELEENIDVLGCLEGGIGLNDEDSEAIRQLNEQKSDKSSNIAAKDDTSQPVNALSPQNVVAAKNNNSTIIYDQSSKQQEDSSSSNSSNDSGGFNYKVLPSPPTDSPENSENEANFDEIVRNLTPNLKENDEVEQSFANIVDDLQENVENLEESPENSNQTPDNSAPVPQESIEPQDNSTRNTQIFDKYLDIYDENLENFEYFTNNPDGTLKKSHKIVEKLNEIVDDEVAKYVEKLEGDFEGIEADGKSEDAEGERSTVEAQFDVFEYAVQYNEVDKASVDDNKMPEKLVDLPLVFRKGEDKKPEVELENLEILSPEPEIIEELITKVEVNPQLSENIPIPQPKYITEPKKEPKPTKSPDEIENAAVKIQSLFRGFKVRKGSKPKRKSVKKSKEPSVFGNELVDKIHEFKDESEVKEDSEEVVQNMETKFEKFGEIMRKIEESDEKIGELDEKIEIQEDHKAGLDSVSNASEPESQNAQKSAKKDSNSNLKAQNLINSSENSSSESSNPAEHQELTTLNATDPKNQQDTIPASQILNPLQGFEKLTQKFEQKLEENSTDQAAVKIQSLFRGFKVRQSQPPRKYKQNVKEPSQFGSELVDKIEEFEESEVKNENLEEVAEDMEVKFEKFGEIMRKIEESEEQLKVLDGNLKIQEENLEMTNSVLNAENAESEDVEENSVQKHVKFIESKLQTKAMGKYSNQTQKIDTKHSKIDVNSAQPASSHDETLKVPSPTQEASPKPSNDTEEANAAVKIQSFFRGFKVRKSNPAKMKKIQEPSAFGSELIDKIEEFEISHENLGNSEEITATMEEKFEKFGEILNKIEESEIVEEMNETGKIQGVSNEQQEVLSADNPNKALILMENDGKSNKFDTSKEENSQIEENIGIPVNIQQVLTDSNPQTAPPTKSTSSKFKKSLNQSKDDETNAAVKIQSFFRGFKVRKSHKPKAKESSAFGAELIDKIEESEAQNEATDEYVEDMEAEFQKFGDIMKKIEESEEKLEVLDENLEIQGDKLDKIEGKSAEKVRNTEESSRKMQKKQSLAEADESDNKNPQNHQPTPTAPPPTPEDLPKNEQPTETDQMSGEEYEEVDQLSTIYEQNSVEEEPCTEKFISRCGPNLEQNDDEKIICGQEENGSKLGSVDSTSNLESKAAENSGKENKKLVGKVSKSQPQVKLDDKIEAEMQKMSENLDINSQKFVKIGNKFVIVEENLEIADETPKTDNEVLENLAKSTEKLSKFSEKMSKSPAKNSNFEVTSENFEEISKQFDQISKEYDKLYRKIEEKFEENVQVLKEKSVILDEDEKFGENSDGKLENSDEKSDKTEEKSESSVKIDPKINPEAPQPDDKTSSEEAKAAVKIQSTFRGYKVRKSRFQKFKDSLSEKFNIKTESKVEEPSTFGSELVEKIKDFGDNEEQSEEIVENMEEKFEKFGEIMRKIEESDEKLEVLDENLKVQEENLKIQEENVDEFDMDSLEYEASTQNYDTKENLTQNVEENSPKLQEIEQKLDNKFDKSQKLTENSQLLEIIPDFSDQPQPKISEKPLQKSSKIPIKQKLPVKSESLQDLVPTDFKSINTLSHSTDHTPHLSPNNSDSNLLRRQSYIDSVIHELEGSNVIEGGLIGYAEQFNDLQAGNVERIGRGGGDDEDVELKAEDKFKVEGLGAAFVENDGKIKEYLQNIDEYYEKLKETKEKLERNLENSDENLENFDINLGKFGENSTNIDENQEKPVKTLENSNNIDENSDEKGEKSEEKLENSIKTNDKSDEHPLNPTTTLKKSSIFPTIPSFSHQKIIPVAKVQPENIKALTSKSQQKPEDLKPAASQSKQASVPNPAKHTKNSMMRQKTMPVQIESSVMRVLPKHLRKRIQSAEGEKKKKRPVLMQ